MLRDKNYYQILSDKAKSLCAKELVEEKYEEQLALRRGAFNANEDWYLALEDEINRRILAQDNV